MTRILATGVCMAAVLSASAGFSQTQTATKTSRMSNAEFQRTIAELGSPSYRVRVAATERLAKRGKLAKPDLAQLAKHKDAEVRSRATQLLARFEPVKKAKLNSFHVAVDEILLLEGGVTVVVGGWTYVPPGAAEMEVVEIDGRELWDVDILEDVQIDFETIESIVLPPVRHVDRADDLPAVDVARFLKELEGTDDD